MLPQPATDGAAIEVIGKKRVECGKVKAADGLPGALTEVSRQVVAVELTVRIDMSQLLQFTVIRVETEMPVRPAGECLPVLVPWIGIFGGRIHPIALESDLPPGVPPHL